MVDNLLTRLMVTPESLRQAVDNAVYMLWTYDVGIRCGCMVWTYDVGICCVYMNKKQYIT